MAESQAKIRLTLDGQQAINEAGRIGRAARGAAGEFNQMATSLVKTVAGLSAIARTIDQAADAAKRIREESAQAAKDLGGLALQRGAAGRSMKLTPQQLQAYEAVQGSGSVSEADQVAFMSALAKQGGKGARGSAGLEYARAFATGAFTQEELLASAKGGKRVDIEGRMSSLSDAERQELALRAHEIQNARKTPDTAGRLAISERERQRRDDPAASSFVEGMEALPLIGGMIRESSMGRLRRSYQRPEDREEVPATFLQGKGLVGEYSRPIPVIMSSGKPQVGSQDK